MITEHNFICSYNFCPTTLSCVTNKSIKLFTDIFYQIFISLNILTSLRISSKMEVGFENFFSIFYFSNSFILTEVKYLFLIARELMVYVFSVLTSLISVTSQLFVINVINYNF